MQALQDPQAEYVKLATVDTVAEKIRAAGGLLLAALRDPGSNMSERINTTLNEFLTWPFRAGAASIVDSQGGKAMFNTVVYTGVETTALEATSIGSDAAAAVIHAVRDLGADEIRAGYEIIAGVKRLKRTHVPGPINTSPLGIILAVDSALSVKEIAELVVEENKNRPSTEWPDMVAVLTKGAVNYAMQMEGGPIMGLFTLPNFTTRRRPLPPMYIHVFMRGVGPLAFNAVCGLLFMHLMTFSPGTKLPTSQAVLDGNPNLGMTFGGYQFNLEGMLKPAPKEEYLAVLYRPLPFRIEDEKGNLLSHIQAIPWQGGAAIKMTGKLPLAGFLPFLGRVATDAQIFEQNDGAISSVLPIGKAEFRELLRRIQAQTNMTVKPEEPKMVVSKMSDEGTSTPVICRLSLSILQLRDVVFSDGAQREKFDEAYQVVFTTILNVRANAKKIAEMIEAHRTGIMSGRTGRIKGHTINIDENIDMPLHSAVAEFLNGSVRLLKDAMQRLLIVLELDVGCLYRKIGGFKTGIAKLKMTDPHLADYLERARAWSESLINLRNDLHEGWLLPKFAYKESAGTIEIEEPRILGETTSAFVSRISDRVFCFTEDVLVHALQARMPPELSIAEIPIADRKPECPERFEHTFIRGGATIWRVVYHDSKFEET